MRQWWQRTNTLFAGEIVSLLRRKTPLTMAKIRFARNISFLA